MVRLSGKSYDFSTATAISSLATAVPLTATAVSSAGVAVLSAGEGSVKVSNLRNAPAHPRKPLFTSTSSTLGEGEGYFSKNHFSSVTLLQFSEYAAHAGGLSVVQPVAVVTYVAVGT